MRRQLAAQGRGYPQHVFLTPIFAFAVVCASMYAASRGSAGIGAVYEAVPDGPVGGPGDGLAGVEVTVASARIVRVVRARVRVADCPLSSPRAIMAMAAAYGPVAERVIRAAVAAAIGWPSWLGSCPVRL